MAAALIIPTKFTAIDKFTRTVNKMARSTKTFATKAQASFARVQRAERRLRKQIGRKLGQFGMMIGFAMLMRLVISTIGVFADFEQANANLSAVMSSATGKELLLLSEDAKRLGSITAKTASEVVGLQEAFARLGFKTPQILDMTQATIAGSVAMNAELSDTAELVGAMIKSFDAFSSVEAPLIIDQMTLSTQMSALNFEKLNSALPNVATAANAAGIPFTQLLALLGKLSDAGIDASKSSRALKNIFIESEKKGHSYTQILESIKKNQHKLSAASDAYGKVSSVTAVVLADNLKGVEALDMALQNTNNTAQVAADKRLATLQGRLTILKSAWHGLILGVEDGNGKFAKFLNTVISVTTEILSLMSGTAKAGHELDATGLKIRNIAEKGIFFIKVIKWAVIGLVAYKAAMIATNVVLVAGKVIMVAWSVASGIATAAQWLLNIALTANPIGIIIVAIGALIALTILVAAKWDTWGKHVAYLAGGPIMRVIDAVRTFAAEWDAIRAAFKEGGLVAGLKRVGQTILRLLLKPLEHVVKLLEMIGIVEKGTYASMLADWGLGEDEDVVAGMGRKGGVNQDATAGMATARMFQTNTTKSTLEILNKSENNAKLNTGDDNIKLSNTLGWVIN